MNGVWKVRRNRSRKKFSALVLLLSSGLLGFVALNGKLPLTGVWDGVDGTNGMQTKDYVRKYGAIYY